MSAFNSKALMITGGTGSFGNTVLKHFLPSVIGQSRIFSRNEKKQDDMRHEHCPGQKMARKADIQRGGSQLLDVERVVKKYRPRTMSEIS